MAATLISSVSPTASVTLAVSTTSARIILPTVGTPLVALLTNLGSSTLFLAFGDVTVVATTAGLPLLPNVQLPVTIGTFTYVAAVSLNGAGAINVTTCA